MIKTIKVTSRFSKKLLAGFYSFSVLPDLRIMFRFSKPDQSEVILYDIGPHGIYK